MSSVTPAKAALSRLPGIAWILAAGVAGFLGAFLLGMAERPEGQTQGRLLVAGALLGAGTGIMPGGRRRSPADVAALLAHDFPATEFLAGEAAAALGPELARLGISGGAVYDALVGAAARQRGRTLLSGDARARPVYEALGVRVRLAG
jgi:hypothetical protein